jgi:CBS domain-containing protein
MSTVADVMNRELLALSGEAPSGEARFRLASQGISAAPVVAGDRPVGMVSWRDLAGAPDDLPVAARMSSPPIVVSADAPIVEAALDLARRGLHHAPVVDGDGRVVGFVSALDLLRALFDLPPRHPPATLRRDPHTGALWGDDARLDPPHAEAAPAAPGVLVVVEQHGHRSERVIIVEACDELRARVREIVAALAASRPFAREIAHGDLRFRCAVIDDPAERLRVRDRALELVDVREQLAGPRKKSPSYPPPVCVSR